MRFVLVHGAWHGGWCFEALGRELERARSRGRRRPICRATTSSQTQLDYARLLGPQPDAVVVGHSLGGLTIPFVEARVRVYLAALLPSRSAYESAFAEGFGGFVRDELGPLVLAGLATDPHAACIPTARARRRTRPSPACARRPRSSCWCSRVAPSDVSIATPARRGRSTRRGRCAPAASTSAAVLELDAGHSPFFTHPVELASCSSRSPERRDVSSRLASQV